MLVRFCVPAAPVRARFQDAGRQWLRKGVESSDDVDQMQALGRIGRVETLQPPYPLFRRDIER